MIQANTPEPNKSHLLLMDDLEDHGITTHNIGDASAPNALLQATFDGHALGRRI